MDPMFGTISNPDPYILASYLVGLVSLFGYSAWIIWQRRQQRALETALLSENMGGAEAWSQNAKSH